MNLYALIWMLLIGAVAGWLAGLVMKGRGFGLLGNIVIGILGAVVGGSSCSACSRKPEPQGFGGFLRT